MSYFIDGSLTLGFADQPCLVGSADQFHPPHRQAIQCFERGRKVLPKPRPFDFLGGANLGAGHDGRATQMDQKDACQHKNATRARNDARRRSQTLTKKHLSTLSRQSSDSGEQPINSTLVSRPIKRIDLSVGWYASNPDRPGGTSVNGRDKSNRRRLNFADGSSTRARAGWRLAAAHARAPRNPVAST